MGGFSASIGTIFVAISSGQGHPCVETKASKGDCSFSRALLSFVSSGSASRPRPRVEGAALATAAGGAPPAAVSGPAAGVLSFAFLFGAGAAGSGRFGFPLPGAGACCGSVIIGAALAKRGTPRFMGETLGLLSFVPWPRSVGAASRLSPPGPSSAIFAGSCCAWASMASFGRGPWPFLFASPGAR